MGAENETRFVVAFDGQAGDLNAVFSTLKSNLRASVAELQSIADKLDLFGQITSNLPKVQAAFDKAKAEVAALREEIAKLKDAGAVPTKALADQLAAAEKAARSAGSELTKQTNAVARYSTELTAAGVNTRNFAAEQVRLAAAVKQANADLAVQQAKGLLGFKGIADVKPQIDALTAAFETLRKSGKLSASELAVAQQLLDQEINKVRASVTGVGAGFTAFKANITSLIAPILAATAALSGVAAAFLAAARAAREFDDNVARVGTVTTLTQAQLDALGRKTLDLARALGVDANEAIKAVFELIRSGVPEENALTVLEAAAKASKAALTDLGTGTKAASILIDSFGLSVDQLPAAFDAIIASGQRGGATLSEFTQSAAGLGNAARATGANFNEVIAVLRVMTDASNDAAGSSEVLAKILIRLGSPEVQGKLQTLGLAGKSLLEVFTTLGERGIPINQFLDLGVVNAKAAVSIAALTNNTKALVPALKDAAESANTVNATNEKLANTSIERTRRFNAEIEAAKINLGETIGTGSRLVAVFTNVAAGYNDATKAAKLYEAGSISATEAQLRMVKAVLGIKPASDEAKVGYDELTVSVASVAQASDKTTVSLAKLQGALQTASDTLAKDSAAFQKLLEDRAALIDKTTEQQIAALKLTTLNASEQLQAQVAIEAAGAKDKLELLRKSGDDQVAAARKVAQQIFDATKKNTDDQKAAQAESGKFLIAKLNEQLGNWSSFYESVTRLATAHLARAKQIEQERADFNRGIEQQLFDIRLAGLSSFDQYLAKVKEIERLAAAAREAGAKGDAESLQKARSLTDQAIAIARTLGEAFSANGLRIVSTREATEKTVALIKGLQIDLNKTLSTASQAERNAADQLATSADEAKARVTELRIEVLKLQTEAFDQLRIGVLLDEASFQAAKLALDDLTKPRTVTITTIGGGGVTGGSGQPFEPGPQAGFARGGIIGRMFGGKVPGTGSGDIVPAELPEGSFVLRKSASRFYGDRLLGRLFQGFAIGGIASRILGTGSIDSTAKPFSVPSDATSNALFVLSFAQRILDKVGSGVAVDATLGFLLRDLRGRIDFVREHTGDTTAIAGLLQTAMTVGLNLYRPLYYGATQAPRTTSGTLPVYTWQDFLAELQSGSIGRPPGFATGGATTKAPIHALVEPQEWIVRPERVRALGSDFMYALNSLKVAPRALAAMLAPPTLPRFAVGGPVGGSMPLNRAPAGDSGGMTVNFTLDASGMTNEAWVMRHVVPVLDRLYKRSR